MSSPLICFCILAIFAVSGCAHRPEETVAAPTVAPPVPAQVATYYDVWAGAPEKDSRYQAPRAKSRSLAVFLDTQTFEYVEDGQVFASGNVTSGAAAHPTPTGNFRILSKDADKRSGSYTNYFDQPTPMPYSLQFHGPYFVHEGYMPGFPESHGCIRLHYEDARLLFDRMRVGDPILVKNSGIARGSNRLSQVFPVFLASHRSPPAQGLG